MNLWENDMLCKVMIISYCISMTIHSKDLQRLALETMQLMMAREDQTGRVSFLYQHKDRH